MANMTIDQALASIETGITIVDSPTNIARALTNSALVARVSLFALNANASAAPQDATLLAGLGTLFSVNGFRLTVRGSIADLSNPLNAPGVALATVRAVFDTSANILAAASSPIVAGAASVVMSSSADVSLAGMIAFT